jgi:hypothetical protein
MSSEFFTIELSCPDPYQEEVRHHKFALLFLMAEHCKTCMEMKLALKFLSNDMWPYGSFTFTVSNDQTKLEQVLKHYRVVGFPALVLLEFGSVKRRWVGFFEEYPSSQRAGLLYSFIHELSAKLSGEAQ